MLELIILIFIIFTSLILALSVYFNNPQSATNKSFILAALSIIFWSIVMYLSVNSPLESTLFYIRLSMLAGTVLAVSFLILSITFPNTKFLIKRVLLIPLLIMMIITMIVAMSPYMFTELKVEGKNIDPIPGPGIVFFMITAIGSNIATFIILVVKLVKSKGLLKNQLRFIVFGTLLMFALLIIANFAAVIVLKTSSFIFLGPLFTLIFLVSVGYAILRHRLFNIRLLVAKAVAYSLLITVISIFFIGPFLLMSSVFFGLTLEKKQLVIYIALTVVIALFFQRLKSLVERFTDKFFFKGRYDANELLTQMGKIMSSEIELEILAKNLLSTLTKEMRITKGAFILIDKDTLYDIISINFSKPLKIDYKQVIDICSVGGNIIFYELEENRMKQLMRELDLVVIIPLKVKEKFIGLMVLGGKASGEIFSTEDLKIINILTSEIAIAVQNSLSYDEIKRFNITLQEEINKATQDLQIANQKLQDLDQLKDDFVSITSHELRTPMTAIRSYSWMALNRPDVDLSEKMKKYLIRILISSDRLINLVSDMLNISRIESGRIEINPEVIDLISLCKDIIDEIYYSKSTTKKINFHLVEQMIPKVFADPNKLRQVFLNIMGNALKFSPPNGNITVGFFTDGLVVETFIKDEGPGISKDDMSRLFKKFGRLDSSYTASATSGGTGLGLFISKSLIDLMHGRIWVESEGLGKGTSFKFSLPVATKENIENADKFRVKSKGPVKELEPVTI